MSELELNVDLTNSQDETKRVKGDDLIRDGFFKGINIYVQGFLLWHIWFHMATSEIRRRYRRTLLGPFWVTLSVSIFIGVMGVVFPILWHTDTKTYLPFFASGFIVWSFVAACITESSGTFLDVAGILKQVSLPYTVYSNTVVLRNLLIMFHHFVVYLLIIVIFKVSINVNMLLIIPAMLTLCFTASWVAILVGFLVARFRDVKQVIASLLQISLFVTPIFWMPSQMDLSWKTRLLVDINPLFHFVSIVRQPLLGQSPSCLNWAVAIGVSIVGWFVTMKVLSKYYRHLVFWL
ncbi:MAG: ABC transporter permease [Legionellaceae bacterium]|nr:ABC transporter permease [Legionellaceae bacterium]